MKFRHSCRATLFFGLLVLFSRTTLASPLPPQTNGSSSRPAISAQIESGLHIESADAKNQSVVLIDPITRNAVTLTQQRVFGPWTLMAVLTQPQGNLAVFENVQDRKGHIVYVGTHGVVLDLPKSLEPTSVPPGTPFRGKTLDEIGKAKNDLLVEDFLRGAADPNFDDVKAALPPLRVATFVGTNHSDDKPTFDYGGFSDEIYVDVGKLFHEIREARAKHDVGEGLIGGWLPVNRFVFSVGADRYWEEDIFAEESPGHFWTQPVWYRVLLVDGGQLKEAHYYYHHLPFPPRGEPAAAGYYEALFHVRSVWQRDLNPPMKIDVPDPRIRDFCLHALALERITRVGDHPKYGYPPLGGINVFGGYGYNNVDTFQDTFNTSMEAFLEWGLFDIAGRYLDDYFSNSVRDDGSIDTRGPEIGQYGKMLTEVARYWDLTQDDRLMRKHLKKIDAIVALLETLHREAKQLPATDISYGIIRGWSEHDSSLKIDPYQFMQPHFSNNAEAARGFHDLGNAWIAMGKKLSDVHLAEEGKQLLEESDTLEKDMQVALAKSVDRTQTPPYLPAVAGDHPTYGKQRAYAEMLESGELTAEQTKIFVDNLAANGQSMFGLLRYGTHIDGFLDYGPAYARLRQDWIREFLLLYYADMTHLYSPGAWTAVESSKIDGTLGGPYCTPAEVAVPVFTKWMLVFEDQDQPEVWLAKATPRDWLGQGRKISVQNAPTRFGKFSFEIRSDIDRGKVFATVHLPEGNTATSHLRVRLPDGNTIQSVTVNGADWKGFSPEKESIELPPRLRGEVRIEVAIVPASH